MICPKCGHENPDSAAMCTNCYYKFRFGHAHGDPSKTLYIASSSRKKWASITLIIIVVIFIVMFVLSIISSVR